MSSNKKISVIITCHNRKDFIVDAIDSLSRQTIPREEFEIIVVKNFKDDQIDVLIEKLSGKNILVNVESLGVKWAEGILASSGEILCFMDDDDIFREDKLDTVIRAFNIFPNTILIHNQVRYVSKNGEPLYWKSLSNRTVKYITSVDQTKEKILTWAIRKKLDFNSSSMSVKKNFIFDYVEAIRASVRGLDTLLYYLVVGNYATVINIPDKLTVYRVHSSVTNFVGVPFYEIIQSKIYHLTNLSESLEILRVNVRSVNIRNLIDSKICAVNAWRTLIDSSTPSDLHQMLCAFQYLTKISPLRGMSFLITLLFKYTFPKQIFEKFYSKEVMWGL